jgi:site-specific DNA-methyltransferase (adenine-specific)
MIRNTIHKGDCLELMPRLLGNKSIDMIFCDLPYGTTQCKWDSIIDLPKLWSEYKRVIKDNGAIVLFGREPFSSTLISCNYKMFKHKWVWDKKQSGSAINAKYMPIQLDEDIIVFAKGKVNYYPIMRKGKMRKRGGYKNGNSIMGKLEKGFENWSDEYYPTNILNEFSNAKRTGRLHPTQKPLDLIEYMIKTYTNQGDLILDNTCGSGTTGLGAKNLKRDYIMMEQDPEYYEIACKRVLT